MSNPNESLNRHWELYRTFAIACPIVGMFQSVYDEMYGMILIYVGLLCILAVIAHRAVEEEKKHGEKSS